METIMQPRGFRIATKRYRRLFWPMMVIYVLTIMACSGLLQEDASPLWLRVTCAIATTLPVVIGIWAVLRMAHEADEYTRARQIRALAESGAMLASGLFLTGFLQMYDVIGRVEVFWFGPAYFFCFGIAYCLRSVGKTV